MKEALQQGIVLVESLNIMWQYIVYKRADVHHLCLRLLVKVGGNRQVQNSKAAEAKNFLTVVL